MIQQINLFQPQFRRQRKPLAAAALLQLLALAAVVFAALYGYQRWQFMAVEGELGALAAAADTSRQQLAATQAKYPAREKSKLLEQELARLETELEDSRQLVDAFRAGSFGDTSGFSGFFEALAKQHIDGTWLTKIRIEQGGRAIALDGRALAPEMVPLYVQRLGNEKAFSGKAFSELQLQRPATEPMRIDFSISAGGLPKAGAGRAGSNG